MARTSQAHISLEASDEAEFDSLTRHLTHGARQALRSTRVQETQRKKARKLNRKVGTGSHTRRGMPVG